MWYIIEDILLEYKTYDHDKFPMTFGLHDTDITCTTMHSSLDIVTVYIVLWSWYILYSLFDTGILDTDSWSYYTEPHTILYLHWLIKLTKPRLLGKTVAGKI